MTTTNEIQRSMFGLPAIAPVKYLPNDVVTLWDGTETIYRNAIEHIDGRFYRDSSELYSLESVEFTIMDEIKTELLELIEKQSYEPHSHVWESMLDGEAYSYGEAAIFDPVLRAALLDWEPDLTETQLSIIIESHDVDDCETRGCDPGGCLEIVKFGDSTSEEETLSLIHI